MVTAAVSSFREARELCKAPITPANAKAFAASLGKAWLSDPETAHRLEFEYTRRTLRLVGERKLTGEDSAKVCSVLARLVSRRDDARWFA